MDRRRSRVTRIATSSSCAAHRYKGPQVRLDDGTGRFDSSWREPLRTIAPVSSTCTSSATPAMWVKFSSTRRMVGRPRLDLGDRGVDGVDRHRRESERGLVDQHDPRRPHKSAAETHEPPLPARQRSGPLFAPRSSTTGRHVDAPRAPRRGSRQTARERAHQEVLLDAHLGEQARLPARMCITPGRDPRRLRRRYRSPSSGSRPPRLQQPADRAQKGRLAVTVRADHDRGLAAARP